jgi:hypothetical protein
MGAETGNQGAVQQKSQIPVAGMPMKRDPICIGSKKPFFARKSKRRVSG